jgi:hypothetical protein
VDNATRVVFLTKLHNQIYSIDSSIEAPRIVETYEDLKKTYANKSGYKKLVLIRINGKIYNSNNS